MSYKIVKFLRDCPAFDLGELVRHSIDAAAKLRSNLAGRDGGGDRSDEQDLSEIALFVLESVQADPGCVSPPDLVRLVESVGRPALQQSPDVLIHEPGQPGSGNGGLRQAVYRLYASLLRTGTDGPAEYRALKARIQADCLEGLGYHVEEQRLQVALTNTGRGEEEDAKAPQPPQLAMRDVLGILDCLFGSLEPSDSSEGVRQRDAWLEDCFQMLLDVLEFGEPTTCSHVSGLLLPKLLRSSSSGKQAERLSAVWKRLADVHAAAMGGSAHSGQAANVYTGLCGLADFLLPLPAPSVSPGRPVGDLAGGPPPPGILAEDAFWTVLQAGLTHPDSLARKQACFVLKKAVEAAAAAVSSASYGVNPETAAAPADAGAADELAESRCSESTPMFWWSAEFKQELLAMWADFCLMYETLDEVQVHVVRPVMPRMTSLIQAASISQSGRPRPLLHTSWLTVLFARCFAHETKTVIQWGLLEYLRLDFKACPISEQVGSEFFLDRVIPVLNDDSIYTTQSSGMGVVLSPIPSALTQFVKRSEQILGSQHLEGFLRDLLLAVSRQQWSSISLLFALDMLMNLPECPVWGPKELQQLREMQFSCVSMLSFSFRSIAQCMTLQCLLRMLDTYQPSLQHFSGLLALLSNCLRRGNTLWKKVCHWIHANRHARLFGSHGDLAASLRAEVAALLTSDPGASAGSAADLGDTAEASRAACLVVLAADSCHAQASSTGSSGQRGDEQESLLHSVLGPLVSVLASMGCHIYLPVAKADTGLQLLAAILTLLNQAGGGSGTADTQSDGVRQELSAVLASCLEEISAFISRQLLSADLAKTADVSRVCLYVGMMESVSAFVEGSPSHSGLRTVYWSVRVRMVDVCRRLAKQTQEVAEQGLFRAFAAVRLLLWLLQSFEADDARRLPWDTLSPLVTVPGDVTTGRTRTGGLASVDLRKMANQVLCTRWQCVSELLRMGAAGALPLTGVLQSPSAVLAACVRDLTLVNGSDAIPIMHCAQTLAQEVCSDEVHLCVELIMGVWSSVQDEWRAKAMSFWELYTAAVRLIFQPRFVAAAPGSEIHAALEKVIGFILALGEGKPKIVTVLAKHLADQWGRPLDGQSWGRTLQAIGHHRPALTDMCIMGHRVTRDTRLQQEICVLLQDLPYLQAIRGDILESTEQRGGQRRVVLLNFLLLVATASSPESRQLITDFVQGFLVKFLELKTTRRHGYTINTQLYRQNVHLWQAVLVLAPYIDRASAGPVLGSVLDAILREKQTSVRHLMIWVALQLVRLEPSAETLVWDCVQTRDERNANLCPLLILIAHLGAVKSDVASKECFYRRAFLELLPWALAQTSSVRHLGLLCVKKVLQDCIREGHGRVLESFPVLQACIDFLQRGISATPSQHKVDSYFFLFNVHPVKDYTFQTVFHILPALSSVADDEFLEPVLFERDCPTLWAGRSQAGGGTPMIHLYNAEDSLIQEQYARFRLISQAPQQDGQKNEQVLACQPSVLGDGDSDVQKKVIPWQDAALPGLEEVPATGQEAERPAGAGGLVLVASLVDKAPNLGGLCRTSQIFGVSTLVVNNIRVTSDRVFQTLSVTAEKWLPIIEVPVSDLSAYLQAMRHKGFTLVGVEQTARSQCLTKYQFPEKTLLLLGHERTGIPVELIQLLDMCVEIPQQGIIRSLNVHVSGALLVWEYTRQRLLAQTAKE